MTRLKCLLGDIRRELESNEGCRPTGLRVYRRNFSRCMAKILVNTICERMARQCRGVISPDGITARTQSLQSTEDGQ
jgi:hypothetical protein